MRLLIIISSFIAIQDQGFCQEETFRKNTISVESGILSRGLLGLSYSRKFLKTNYLFFCSDAFTGIGANGLYFGLGPAINLGRDEVFLSIGTDVKHCVIQYDENFLFKEYYFKGFVWNPYIGLSLFTPSGLSVKIRAGFMPIYKNQSYDGFFPTAGVSLGYSF